jgi:Protein of unknown function (DUF4089)
MMNEPERDAYVRAALTLQGYALPEERIQEIARQFARIEAIAATIADVELPMDAESAAVFRP